VAALARTLGLVATSLSADTQNLELKLFIAQLTLAFFFEPVPKELDSYEGIEVVARHPEHSFVRPVPWSQAQ
jgi:hypothetical protein